VNEGGEEGEEGHEGQREGQELNSRICSHNLDLETTWETFMFYGRPSPLCPCASVKRSSHCQCVKQLRFWTSPTNK
jgi:hypothetical protein